MDEDNREESSKEVFEKKDKWSNDLQKSKKNKILNQNLECGIFFDDLGDPIRDNALRFEDLCRISGSLPG